MASSGAQASPEPAISLPGANRSPLVQVVGLPTVADNSALHTALQTDTAPLSWRFTASSFSLSSQSTVRDESGNELERVLQDGEVSRLELAARWRVGKRSALGIALPWIAHHSGNADQAIEQWHSIFGLPNSNRGRREQDQLEYRYVRDGQQRLLFNRNRAGPGDIDLHWQTLLARGAAASSEAQPAANAETALRALRIGVKLPTGSRSKLTGNGVAAAYAELAAADTLRRAPRWRWQLAAGMHFSEGGGLLGDLRRNNVAFGSASVAYRAGPRWQLKLQLESHGRIYRSASDEIGQEALQLAAGADVRIAERTRLELFFTEDLLTRSSPDFGLGIGLRHYPLAR